MFASGDLQTETFTNSQGWTVVRVTHVPTGESAERKRSKDLASSVQAQTECIAELRDRVAAGPMDTAGVADRGDETLVTRAEFEALATRVAKVEAEVGLQED